MWTIEDTNEKKPAGSNFSSIIGGVTHSGSSVVSKWSDDEIHDFIEKASKLEEEKMSLEANLD